MQHHRAHIASVLAERGEWDKQRAGSELRRHRIWRRRQHLGRRVFCRQREAKASSAVAHLRRADSAGRRRGSAASGAGSGRISGAGRRAARSERCAIQFSFALSAGDGIGPQRKCEALPPHRGTAFRYGRGLAGLHTWDHFRGTGGDVAGGSCSQGERFTKLRTRFRSPIESWTFVLCYMPLPKKGSADAASMR